MLSRGQRKPYNSATQNTTLFFPRGEAKLTEYTCRGLGHGKQNTQAGDHLVLNLH